MLNHLEGKSLFLLDVLYAYRVSKLNYYDNH